MSLDDLSGQTPAELRAAAERYRAEAQQRIVDALDPVIGLALVVLELERLTAQAGAGQVVFVDLSSLKIKGLHSTAPFPVFTAPDANKPALRMQKPRFDSDFDLFGVRSDGWLLVYKNLSLEYWVRLADVRP